MKNYLYDTGYLKTLFSKETYSWKNKKNRPLNISIFYDIQKFYLQKYIEDGDLVLEIGAGEGEFTNEIIQNNVKLIVSDISEQQLKLNKAFISASPNTLAIIEWEIYDITEPPIWESNSFNKIIALGGPLSYALDKTNEAIENIYRLLKKGGVAIFGVMNLWGTIKALPQHFIDLPKDKLNEIVNTGITYNKILQKAGLHKVKLFTPDSITRILIQHSFSIVEMTTTNFLSLEGNSFSIDYSTLLKAEINACKLENSLNSGDHLIVIAKKE